MNKDRIAMVAAAAAAVAGLFLAGCTSDDSGFQTGDNGKDDYLALVADRGVPTSKPGIVLAIGYTTCDGFDNVGYQETIEHMVSSDLTVENVRLTPDQLGAIAWTSVETLCPRHKTGLSNHAG